MVLDESLTDFPALINALDSGGLDAARLKLSRFGGITPLRKAREFVRRRGSPSRSRTPLEETS